MQLKANSLPWQNYLGSTFPCACADGSSLACSSGDECSRLDILLRVGRFSRRHFLTTGIIEEGRARNTRCLTNQVVSHGRCPGWARCDLSWALLEISASERYR